MDADDFVQLVLLAMDGEIKGKTKLQKTVYFASEKAGCKDELGYHAHFYGPFSSEVADAAERLHLLGLAGKTETPIGGVDRQGFEATRHDYRLTEEGTRIAKKKADRNPGVWSQIEQAVKAIRDAGDPGYMDLSIAAKTYYMLGESGGSASVGELSELAEKFGWSVSVEKVGKAVDFLLSLELVKQ
jgi:uncharacterized protein YwgA